MHKDIRGYSWEVVKPTYIENWPEELFNISIPTYLVRLSKQEAEDLFRSTQIQAECDSMTKEKWQEIGNRLIGTKPMSQVNQDDDTLAAKMTMIMQATIGGCDSNAFVRLGSRSPKDSYAGYSNGFNVSDGIQALALLRDSERIWNDLMMARHYEYTPTIALRRWVNIDPHLEFRCLVTEDSLWMSQYFYDKPLEFRPGLDAQDLLYKANRFIRDNWDTLKKCAPDDGGSPALVVDIYFEYDFQIKAYSLGETGFTPEGYVSAEPKLLEVNPFSEVTDPCLFKWDMIHNLPKRTFWWLNENKTRTATDL